MKLLYESIPDNIKNSLWLRFKKRYSKEIVKLQKTIDITELYENASINLLLSNDDFKNKRLKIIHIITNSGIYYLYLIDFCNIQLNNKDYIFSIHFYIRN